MVTGTGLDCLASLIKGDELVDGQFAAVNGFVADDDRVNVAVMPRQIERRADLPLDCDLILAVVLLIQAPTVTLRPNSAAIGGTSSGTAGRRIGANRPGMGAMA